MTDIKDTIENDPHKLGRESKSNKELMKLVASTSGYHLYEVKDILTHLVGNMRILLSQGTSVKIDGLGTFKKKQPKPRKFKGLDGIMYESNTSASVSLKPDTSLKKLMRESSNAGCTALGPIQPTEDPVD